MTRWIFVFASIICAGAAFGQDGKDEREIRQLASSIQTAKVRSDFAFLADAWTKDFAYTNSRGEYRSRELGLEDYRSGAVKWTLREIDDMTLRLTGEVGVLTARVKLRGTVRGQDRADDVRLTDVYVKRSGKWRLFASHESRIQP